MCYAGRTFGGRGSRRNFNFIDSRSNDLTLLCPCGYGFEYSATFRDMVPSGPLGLPLRRELGRLFGRRLCRGMVIRPVGLSTVNRSSLRVGGPALLPLTATTIVSSVVGITVGTPLLFLCTFLPKRVGNHRPRTSGDNRNYASCDRSAGRLCTVWVPWEPDTFQLSL